MLDIKIVGLILGIDAILSLIVVKDKRIIFQLGRLVRFCLGVYLIII